MLAESVSSRQFSGLDLGDIRLNDRLIDVADAGQRSMRRVVIGHTMATCAPFKRRSQVVIQVS